MSGQVASIPRGGQVGVGIKCPRVLDPNPIAGQEFESATHQEHNVQTMMEKQIFFSKGFH